MATERIIIENFKGIKKLDLEVRPFTVLTGPQSVGKSTTAKLLYFFRNIAREAFTAAMWDTEIPLEAHLIGYFWKLMPPPTHGAGKAAIHYSVGNSVFSLSAVNGDAAWRIEVPKVFQDEFATIKNEWSKSAKQAVNRDVRLQATLERIFFHGLETKMGTEFVGWPLFVPAGRSFYAHIERDPISFFENATLDPFIAEFGKLLSRFKFDIRVPSPHAPFKLPKCVRRATELAEQLLSGRYLREGKRDFIITRDEQKIPSTLWSSGQQESFPLVNFLCLLCRGTLEVNCLFVEEPEVSLFPTSQRNIVELLALAFNAQAERMDLFITTHSPYVLSMLNVLLLAGQVGGGKLKKGHNEGVVNPMEIFAPESFGAYYMNQNECYSIIDKETGLINGRGIDDVSDEISEQFDAVSRLQ